MAEPVFLVSTSDTEASYVQRVFLDLEAAEAYATALRIVHQRNGRDSDYSVSIETVTPGDGCLSAPVRVLTAFVTADRADLSVAWAVTIDIAESVCYEVRPAAGSFPARPSLYLVHDLPAARGNAWWMEQVRPLALSLFTWAQTASDSDRDRLLANRVAAAWDALTARARA